ncbi:MAG: SpoIIE family protein phosphatase [Pseudomonadales bacterium]|jgi:protein phosphatase|nr:SpoIIE family protein phosphatase [Pseudomonadales bacterium]MDP6470208.1 SpoIIE family protein phosphatase [Pseudomonadales bacterium]MDP6827114.1 SpoIIE family protein phosphatase [Pseudomonadales bacterium]MDP6971552.1 SpoIIE family protein phosphatase [Pseudomonadales bacterium]|tara:strand:+ start:472 stop:951 length:480 start_codon:yes stop_codon:yes gene_type:complete
MQLLLKQKHISPEDARNHPRRNVVTQVLGVGDPKPDTASIALRPGDWLLLCTDGLNDELTDDEIGAILQQDMEFSELAKALVRAACDAGGRDNVTALVLAPDVAATAKSREAASAVADEVFIAESEAVRQATVRRLARGGLWVALVAAMLVSAWFLWGG